MTKRIPKHLHKDVGRPEIMTDDIILKLEQSFSLGCTDLEACLYAGIGKSTLYKYQTEHPEFIDRKEILKETTILQARQTVVKSLKSNPDMALKYLERKRKHEFSLRTETTGAGGGPIQNDNHVTIEIVTTSDEAKSD